MEPDAQFEQELKHRLLEMMAWFHRFCVDHGIRYYAIDGTMLGAARHRGFIPWDDDIDVGIPRRDYERLAMLMGQGPKGRYVLETPHSGALDFIYTYSKLYDTTTTLKEHAKKDVVRGIFLDIFPLDGIGDTLETARRNFRGVDRLFSLYMARVVATRPGRQFHKNLAVKLVQWLPDCVIDDKRLQLKVDAACKKLDFDDCEFVGNLLGTWRFRDVMEKTIMGKPTPYQFEDIVVWGVENYDAYLTHLYGDWRMLPPADKRISRHDFLECSLDAPFAQGGGGLKG
jgi:lipopolysaccharide cholinephosphotransferase